MFLLQRAIFILKNQSLYSPKQCSKNKGPTRVPLKTYATYFQSTTKNYNRSSFDCPGRQFNSWKLPSRCFKCTNTIEQNSWQHFHLSRPMRVERMQVDAESWTKGTTTRKLQRPAVCPSGNMAPGPGPSFQFSKNTAESAPAHSVILLFKDLYWESKY